MIRSIVDGVHFITVADYRLIRPPTEGLIDLENVLFILLDEQSSAYVAYYTVGSV